MPKHKKQRTKTPIVEYRRSGGFAATEAAAQVRAPKSDKIHRHVTKPNKSNKSGLTHSPFEGLLEKEHASEDHY